MSERTLVVCTLLILLGTTVRGQKTEDSLYTHWPTVEHTAINTSKLDLLTRQVEDLLLKPVTEIKRPAKPEGTTPGWAALKEAGRYFQQKEFALASRTAEQALSAARDTRDRRLEMLVLGLIGNISRDVFLGASLKAVPYHEESLLIAMELKDSSHMITQLTSIADNYGQAGRDDRFMEYVERTIPIFWAYDVPRYRIRCCVNFACFLETQNRARIAEKLFRLAIPLTRQVNDLAYVQHLHWQLFWLYLEMKDAGQAAAALDSVQSIVPKMPVEDFYEGYYQLEKLRGNSKQAFYYLEKAYQALGTQYSKRSAEQLAGWETRLRTREKEIELDVQKRQRWIYLMIMVLLAALFSGAVYAVFQQRRSRKKITLQRDLIEVQANELRHLDEVKSRFFANVSHELRTPLTLLLGPLGTVSESRDLSERNRALVRIARKNTKKLLDLINEILDLSKLDARKLELNEAPVQIFPLVRRLGAAFESHAERLNIQFAFHFKAEKSLQLELDAAKVETIVNNLLSNALKFTPSGGKVTIEVEDLGNVFRLKVRDTGRGIHPDDLPHVFNRFYQSAQPGAPAEGGTGIGLALSHELAVLMNGGIEVESKLGEGSIFTLELPRKEVFGVVRKAPMASGTEQQEEDFSVEGAGVAGSDSVAHDAATVLVVEDNSDLREFLKLILSAKYRVEVAENGRGALDLLEQRHRSPDLIISDLMMPIMDGFQLLEELKSDDRYRHIPVVMLSARADLQDKLRALRTGVDDYLIKPFEELELMARIENLLQFARQRHEQKPAEPHAAGTLEEDEPVLLSADDARWLEELEVQTEKLLGDPRFNTELLAQAMYLSSRQLQRRLKSASGLTPNQYIQEARLQRGRRLLESGKYLLKQAASEVGYKDAHYFSNLYQERFGRLPAQ